jgi:coenzyme F420-reducing hydrogenase alpha subunit
MDEQIVPNRPYVEVVEISQISEYINLAFQLIPIADKALDLAKQLDEEKTNRLAIRENADIQRKMIERRMDQLDAELEADLENNKNVIAASMRAFEKMVEAGHIEQAMILHERVISRLSGRVSLAADKFNQNNPDGQVKFYTT